MTDTPNVFSSFLPTGDPASIVQPGDVALLLKKDGSVHALSFGYDRTRLFGPESDLTDDDKLMIQQGKKLFALALAAQNAQLMALLLDIAADPEVVDFEALKRHARLN